MASKKIVREGDPEDPSTLPEDSSNQTTPPPPDAYSSEFGVPYYSEEPVIHNVVKVTPAKAEAPEEPTVFCDGKPVCVVGQLMSDRTVQICDRKFNLGPYPFPEDFDPKASIKERKAEITEEIKKKNEEMAKAETPEEKQAIQDEINTLKEEIKALDEEAAEIDKKLKDIKWVTDPPTFTDTVTSSDRAEAEIMSGATTVYMGGQPIAVVGGVIHTRIKEWDPENECWIYTEGDPTSCGGGSDTSFAE